MVHALNYKWRCRPAEGLVGLVLLALRPSAVRDRIRDLLNSTQADYTQEGSKFVL